MMKTPRLRVSSGSHSPSKIAEIAPYRPFTQQLDLVFPSNHSHSLLEVLQTLRSSYSKGKVRLSDVVNKEVAFVKDRSDFLLVSNSRVEEDVWCIAPHANLALSVCKDTYERLGLPGYKLSSIHSSSARYVIDIPLRKFAQSPKTQANVRDALARWDEICRTELWDVVYCSRSPNIPISDIPWNVHDAQVCHVTCETREMRAVHIPVVSFGCGHTRSPPSDSDASDDWNQVLFEWVGMCCLGSQRLFANDRIDPFIAVYEPPEPAYVGDVVCLRWKGLLPPEFVQQVLNIVTANLRTSPAPPFVAITVHGFTNSPVSYLPQKVEESGDLFSKLHLPLKSPQQGGQDTWVMIVAQRESTGDSVESPETDAELKWCLMDILG